MPTMYRTGERVVATVLALDALPPASVVETGDGHRYVKKISGAWHFDFAKNTPAAWLIDPEHSRQPLSVLYVPDHTNGSE